MSDQSLSPSNQKNKRAAGRRSIALMVFSCAFMLLPIWLGFYFGYRTYGTWAFFPTTITSTIFIFVGFCGVLAGVNELADVEE